MELVVPLSNLLVAQSAQTLDSSRILLARPNTPPTMLALSPAAKPGRLVSIWPVARVVLFVARVAIFQDFECNLEKQII
jgi:hypothetical protein